MNLKLNKKKYQIRINNNEILESNLIMVFQYNTPNSTAIAKLQKILFKYGLKARFISNKLFKKNCSISKYNFLYPYITTNTIIFYSNIVDINFKVFIQEMHSILNTSSIFLVIQNKVVFNQCRIKKLLNLQPAAHYQTFFLNSLIQNNLILLKILRLIWIFNFIKNNKAN